MANAYQDWVTAHQGVDLTIGGYYSLGDASGNGLDGSGGSHPIVWTGSPTYGSTVLNGGTSAGTSMALSGTGQYGTIATYAGNGPGLTDFWGYILFKTSANTGMVLCGSYDWADTGWGLYFDGTNLFLKGFGTDIVSANNTTEGWRSGSAREVSWNVDRDSATGGQMYRGTNTTGAAVNVTAAAANNKPGTNKVIDVGSRHGSGNSDLAFNGNLAHFIWGYNSLLTPTHRTELNTIFTTGAYAGGGSDPSPVASAVRSTRKVRIFRGWRVSG